MFTPITRAIFVILNVVIAVYFYTREEFLIVFLPLISALLFIYGYFKYGTINLVHQKLKKQQVGEAEKLLATIKNPDRLSNSHKSYYYFSKGIIAVEKKEWKNGLVEFTKALDIGLRTENDTSLALLSLANIELELKNYTAAKDYIAKAQQYDLKPTIEAEMEQLIQNINEAQEKTTPHEPI